MSVTSPTQNRIDPKIKAEASKLFKELGLDLSTAVNIFLRQCIRVQGLLFKVGKGERCELDRAISEVETALREPYIKVYNNPQELFDELDKEAADQKSTPRPD